MSTIDHIDTRHGTANHFTRSHGNCLPYTGVPFGMNYFAPQTSSDRRSWWFHPDDVTFQGYRLTHQPSPWMGDFSRILLTPVSGNIASTHLKDIEGSYRPEEAVFRPTHLTITQNRYQITSTLVPSTYGGILELSYGTASAGLVLTLPGRYTFKKEDAHTISGSVINFSGSGKSEDPDLTFYFILSFEQKVFTDLSEDSGEDGALLLSFEDIKHQTVKFGTSFIGLSQARLNLSREKPQSYTDYLTNSTYMWENYLDRIRVTHSDYEQTKTFYHNLYRSFLFPQKFFELDQDNQRIHYNTSSKRVAKGTLYTNNGFWDTYKSVYPLYSLIAQEEYEDMLEGFLTSYQESGYLPRWLSPDERGTMPGTMIDAVIADAAVKHIAPDLIKELYSAMKKSATVQSEKSTYGRQGIKDYLTYGYVPNIYPESVNHTLDSVYSDFCLYQVATKLHYQADADFYLKQSQNYRHLFDPTNGLMRSKDKEGIFREPFIADKWGEDYTEGSAWQSSFAVYHDFDGLINLYESSEAFQDKLVDLCNQAPTFDPSGYGIEIHEITEMATIDFGQVAISNQPSFHLPFLFTYIGKPEMAQPLLKQLMMQNFNASKTGYPGDEDNGSMSCWYIFNSLGFYPVTPGSGEYVIGMPLVDHAEIDLSTGETLTITATPNKQQQLFIDAIDFDGHNYQSLFFKHDDLIKGGNITYHLGIVPHPRDYQRADLPYSVTKDVLKS